MCNCTEMVLFMAILYFIPIIYGLTNVSDCGENMWLEKNQEKKSCCEYCHPGTFMTTACNTVNRTKCEVCPQNTFMDQKNNFGSCFRCSRCEQRRDKNMVLKSACTRQMDTTCKCMQGFYHYELGDNCIKCSICKRGFIIKKDCTETSDRICERCKLGHYYERNGKCMKCTACAVGFVKTSQCNATADTKCQKVKETTPATPDVNENTTQKTDWSKILIAVVVSCSVLVIAVVVCLIIFCCKKYLSNGRPLAVNRSPPVNNRSSRNDEICIPMEEEEFSSLIRVSKIPLVDLKYKDREELSALLDPHGSNNWRNLACEMGKRDLYIQNLERSQQSPTMTLIRDFEVSVEDPSMQDLLQLCNRINRKDAASVVKKAINSHSNRPEV